MRSPEYEKLPVPEIPEERELISRLRQECGLLLDRCGTKEGFLWFRKKMVFASPVHSRAGVVKMEITSNNFNPVSAEWIMMKPEKHMCALVLTKTGRALIFEDWGLGERLDKLEMVREHLSSEEELITTNPRAASLEEIQNYRDALGEILAKYPSLG